MDESPPPVARFDPLALRDEARESYEKSCALVRKAIESKNFEDLKNACEGFDPSKLSWRAGHLKFLPLPAAARAGWTAGVEYLAAEGCDPNKPDGGRTGWSGGEAPLAEALSRGDYSMAEALSRLGARVEPLGDMVWAASFLASRGGVGAGLEALSWLGAKGFDAWADVEHAKSSQSCYLFAGSLGSKSWSRQDRQSWEEALFGGADLARAGARDCAWHMLFGGVGSSPDAGVWLAERYIGGSDDPSACALGLLRWAFEGSPCLAEASLAVLGPSEASDALSALRAACGQAPARRDMSISVAALETAAFDLAWREYGPAWSARAMELSEAAARALANGRMGLGARLLESGADSSEVAKLWRSMGVGVYAGEGEAGQQRKDGLSTILLASKDPQSAWEQFNPWMLKAFPSGLDSALSAAQSSAIKEAIGLGRKASSMRL